MSGIVGHCGLLLGTALSGLAAWDAATKGGALTLSNDDLTVERTTGSNGDGNGAVATGKAISSGKFYAEVSLDAYNPHGITGSGSSPGIAVLPTSVLGDMVASSTLVVWGSFNTSKTARFARNGSIGYGVSGSASGTAISVGNRWCVAVDVSSKTVWFGRNGTWVSGDPGAGTGGYVVSGFDAPLVLAVACYNTTTAGDKVTLRATTGSLAYSIPSGFSAYADA